ncbi:dihydrofolate reductase [Diaminobutyricimonas sp. LJ205]|uniref:dihydrofolate reductase n=1 Tax=Diaminobutyricimonas sp. LJ205 TaxID=2683590 RepID=UPI0012F4842E
MSTGDTNPNDVSDTTAPRIGLIWAQARGGVIGKDGQMPWHLPEDLAHFKAITIGSTVIMGRRTWDSLPPRFRPLSDRRNVVVTRQDDWQADGAEVMHSVAAALQTATPGADGFIWVIGGGQIFDEVIGDADRLEVTEIDADVDGDVTAPAIDDNWTAVAVDPNADWLVSRTGLRYRFLSYVPGRR